MSGKWTYLLVCLILVLTSTSAFGVVEFYVDPNWSGEQTGIAATPWTNLGDSEWNSINNALASDDVVVYFSSNRNTTNQLKILRQDQSIHRLTLDGTSKQNIDIASPSWENSQSKSRFKISNDYPITTTTQATKRNYVTIKGFRAESLAGQAIFYWGGDYVIIEDNEAYQLSTAIHGPTVYFQYARDRGSNESPCVPNKDHNCGCKNITIRNNIVHDSYGESIYIGGVNEFCTNSTNLCRIDDPSHSNVTIEGNLVYDPGKWGGESDGIDVKNAMTNVTIRKNTVYMSTAGSGRDGIIVDGGAAIEQNFVYNFGRSGITLDTTWNTYPTRDGSKIINNLIVNTGGNPAYSWDFGIRVSGSSEGDQYTNTNIINNTIYGTNGNGIDIHENSGGTLIFNNVLAQTSDIPLIVGQSGILGQHDNNLYYFPSGTVLVRYGTQNYSQGNLQDFEPNSIASDPNFADQNTPYTPEGFQLTQGSIAIDKGVTLSLAGTDFYGNPRVNAYDLGAFEYYDVVTPSVTPSPPSGLQVVQ